MSFALRWAFRFISFALLLVLLAWLTGRIASDRFLWTQFLLWAPTPIALLAALLGTIIALGRAKTITWRSRPGAWALALLLLLVYFVQFEHRLLRRPAPDPPGLRIVHWNAWPEEGDDSAAYFKPIEDVDADIYVLTDAWHVPWRSKAAERFGEEAYLASTYPFAIISRVPILEVRPAIAHEKMYLAVLVFDTTERFGKPLTIHAVDQPSGRDLIRVDVAEHYLALMAEQQVEPADVAVGDYNMTPGVALRRLTRDMRNAYDQAGHGWRGTFPREWPLAQIDHIFVREPYRALRYDIIDPGISRHRLQRVWIDRVGE